MEYLVVGLGNIGAEYANTRHNMGFMVLDAWAQASNVLFKTFGSIRMRANGSSGGHNGLQDITDKLESDQWARIRVGIGNEFSRGRQVDYVLGPLSDEEKAEVPQLAARIIQGIKDVSTIGIGRAMNTLNTRPKPEKTEKKENVADS